MIHADEYMLKSLADKLNIRLVLVFGSYASGKTHKTSDLDIAVMLKERPPKFSETYFDVYEGLQKVFPDKEIDLAFINYADPLFLKKISETCILLYGKQQDYHEFKMLAYKKYIDHKRYLKLEKEYVDNLLSTVKTA